MRPHLFLLSLALMTLHPLRAQYADMGNGVLKNQIWWLDWANFTMSEGLTRTWQTNNGLTITATFTNVNSHLYPTQMNMYFGAVLHTLYNFSNPAIRPALYDLSTSLPTTFKMSITVSKGASPVGFTLITADAEASTPDEKTTLQTNGSPWETFTFFRNTSQTDNPLAGCGTQTAVISNTFGNGSQLGQNPIIGTRNTTAGPLVLDIKLDHTITVGGMALAFGILEAVDRGDLPASYGEAQHEIFYTATNVCNYNPPYPQTIQYTALRIGALAGDPDPMQTVDDNVDGADEDGLAVFPPYDNNGAYSLTIPVTNTTGHDTYLTGWFDYNRNAKFDAGESVTVTIPNNGTSGILAWTSLPQYLPQGAVTDYGIRLRLCSSLQESQSATGNASDGEVEDYIVPATTLCTISVSAKPDTAVCPGSAVPFRAKGVNVTDFLWTGSNDFSDPAIANPTLRDAGTTAASYTVTVGNPQGCTSSASASVTILPKPSIVKSSDTLICEGKSITLSASGGVSTSWTTTDGSLQTIAPSVIVAPTVPTRYYIKVTNSNGCSRNDSIDIAIHSLPVFDVSPKTSTICKNDSVVLIASGGDHYAWSSSAGPIPGDVPRLVAHLGTTDDFQVQITDTLCQLASTLYSHVTVGALPGVSISKSNDINCTLGEATLHASGGFTYAWDLADSNLSDRTSATPIVRPLIPTWYHVTVTNARGCSARDSILVNTDYSSDLNNYPVPSAFTPNNDGHNDCFRIRNWGRIVIVEMEVFNRWGERVFISRNQDGCWDGTFKGAPQPTGTYVYQIKATTPCGFAYRKGTFMLVR